MGILNVTPDSFSDGGTHADPVADGLAMMAAGVDIIDIGGESTKPGSHPVPVDVEIARVVPVIEALAKAGATISADTRNAATMRAALAAGATIINDVSALAHDPQAAATVAEAGCMVVLMHMRGTPETMVGLADYVDVTGEVLAELSLRVKAALTAGIARGSIAIDPGIGFAKRSAQNITLLRELNRLSALGLPILVGVSRKGVIGHMSGEANASGRAAGSIAAGLFALNRGASILRVHDVAATVQAVRVWRALNKPT